MHTDLTDMLTLNEAAARIRRSDRTIRRWVAQGDLPGAVRIKKRLLIPRSALDSMVKPAFDLDAPS